MKTSVAMTMAGLMFATAPALADRSLDFQPGMWESKVDMRMEGVPMAIPPHTTKQCLTAKDIADREDKLFHPASEDPTQTCKVKGYVHKGSTVTMHLVCMNSEGSADFHGKIIIDSKTAYHGGFDGDVTTELGPMKMHQTFTGRRIGDCSK